MTKSASKDSDLFIDQKPPENNPTVFTLEWLLENDESKVCRSVSFESQQQWRNRELLRKVSNLFDPLSSLDSFSIRGKLILKQI